MIDAIGLATVGVAFGVMVASPGPATVAVMATSMSVGRKVGMRFGFGLSVGHIFWGCVAATGLGAVLQAASQVLFLLKLIGGGYLCWLAYCSFQSAARKSVVPINADARQNWFLRGLMLNLTNPKVVVAWIATLSLGVTDGENPHFIYTATILCIGLAFLTNATYALVFSTSVAMEFYSRFRRRIEVVVAGLYAFVGLSLIRSAFSK